MEKNRGLKRIWMAFCYSLKGLVSAFKHEEAFRQEFIVFLVLVALSFYFDVTPLERLMMITSAVFVMIVEIINSAIETVVDRVSTDKHKLSGRAKDYGSLAVLMSILVATATWLTILLAPAV
jgi:diacylglycerol kinase (ATP)